MFLTRKCQGQAISKSRSVGSISQEGEESPVNASEHLDEEQHDTIRTSAVRHCRQRLGFLRRRRSDNSISVRPDRAQAQQWAASFVNLVNSKYGVALFRAFLSQEFADENLEFWLAVEDFKKTRHSKMAAKALQIYNEFLVTQAPREINVDSATRTAIQSGLSAPDAHLFDAAQRRVQHLMESDIFPRFLQSPMYQELLRDEQGKSRARR
ncbi:regulator of G-protein signaling 8-like isoform X1 [Amphibalanus amphitrite]|uniref:regulator of G-protein signaling 8-like isoform X1 n=1 Tax=Amphibalanus amphitrite TaxID=1232801 RepID=UPI001C9284C6|nr:regulator of G-protein signaling 8-like isoform X1 [Amphibalanus amphitrite]